MIDNTPYNIVRYHQLLEKNMVITILSEHSISLTDIDNMPLLDRDYIYDKLVERQEHIKKQFEQNKKKK